MSARIKCPLAVVLTGLCAWSVAYAADLRLVGDETLSRAEKDNPKGSWGETVGRFLLKNNDLVVKAVPGVTTRTIVSYKDWKRVLDKVDTGDWVGLQFGLNDRMTDRPKGVTVEEYRANLTAFVADVRAKEAFALLVTPVRGPEAEVGPYAQAMRTVARETGADLVDLRQLAGSAEDGETLGRLFLEDVRRRKLAVAALFGDGKPVPPRVLPVVKRRAVALTPETEGFFRQLREIGRSGRFFYSWMTPWYPHTRAYEIAITNCFDRIGPFDCRPRPVEKADLGLGRVQALVGRDVNPLVYFAELSRVAGTFYGRDYYVRNRAAMETLVKKAYADWGSVPVFCWHLENPYTPDKAMIPKYGSGSMYNYQHKVPGYPKEHRWVFREILTKTGGPCGAGRNINLRRKSYPEPEVVTYPNPRAWFDARVGEVADFINRLTDGKGRPIPCVVRLFHECEDTWPWWGADSVARDDYVSLFRYTVGEIRRLTRPGQVLFMYSPDRNWETLGDADSKHDFMYRYPGDEYVDVMGYDDYSIGKMPYKDHKRNRRDRDDAVLESRLQETIHKMRLITAEAERRGKACGLIETGFTRSETAGDDAYDMLLRALTADGVRFGLVNTWTASTIPGTPSSNEVFKRFVDAPQTVTTRKVPRADWRTPLAPDKQFHK